MPACRAPSEPPARWRRGCHEYTSSGAAVALPLDGIRTKRAAAASATHRPPPRGSLSRVTRHHVRKNRQNCTCCDSSPGWYCSYGRIDKIVVFVPEPPISGLTPRGGLCVAMSRNRNGHLEGPKSGDSSLKELNLKRLAMTSRFGFQGTIPWLFLTNLHPSVCPQFHQFCGLKTARHQVRLRGPPDGSGGVGPRGDSSLTRHVSVRLVTCLTPPGGPI